MHATPTGLYLRQIDSPVGPLTLGATREGVCLCEFNGLRTRRELEVLGRLLDGGESEATVERDRSRAVGFLDQLEGELLRYFAGDLRAFATPLHLPGTDFQRSAWAELVRIPYGTTCTYLDVAKRLGKPNAMRAVGLANGQNRVAIVVPCHRVIDASGSLRGYGGGLEKKRFLLELEGAIAKEPALFAGDSRR